MRHWTAEERQTQSALIHRVQPWLYSTGPTSEEGKERSKMNARKHGLYSQEFKHYKRLMRDMKKGVEKLYHLQRLRKKPNFTKKDVQSIIDMYKSEGKGNAFIDDRQEFGESQCPKSL